MPPQVTIKLPPAFCEKSSYGALPVTFFVAKWYPGRLSGAQTKGRGKWRGTFGEDPKSGSSTSDGSPGAGFGLCQALPTHTQPRTHAKHTRVPCREISPFYVDGRTGQSAEMMLTLRHVEAEVAEYR